MLYAMYFTQNYNYFLNIYKDIWKVEMQIKQEN